MIVWSQTEIAVFIAVGLMVVFKLWSVWHVSLKSRANRQGRMIFLGLISCMTLFGIIAKFWISHQMAI